MTETLFTFLLVLAFLFFVSFIKNQKHTHLIFSAIFLGLSILCRPMAVYLPFIFAAIIFTVRLKTKASLLFLFLTYLIISPWVIRNYNTFGSPFLSTIGDITFLFYAAASVKAEKEQKTLFEIQNEYKEKSQTEYDWFKPEESLKYARFSREEAVKIIKENPVIFIKNYFKSFFYFFSKPLRNYIDLQLGNTNQYHSITELTDGRLGSLFMKATEKTSFPAICIVIFQLILLLVLTIFSAIFILSKKNINSFIILIFLVILYFAAISSLTEVDARMRVPVIPLWSIIASGGISLILYSKRFSSTLSPSKTA